MTPAKAVFILHTPVTITFDVAVDLKTATADACEDVLRKWGEARGLELLYVDYEAAL